MDVSYSLSREGFTARNVLGRSFALAEKSFVREFYPFLDFY